MKSPHWLNQFRSAPRQNVLPITSLDLANLVPVLESFEPLNGTNTRSLLFRRLHEQRPCQHSIHCGNIGGGEAAFAGYALLLHRVPLEPQL
jgi:hypothetical protein